MSLLARLDRRSFLRVGYLGGLGLTLGDFLALEAAAAREGRAATAKASSANVAYMRGRFTLLNLPGTRKNFHTARAGMTNKPIIETIASACLRVGSVMAILWFALPQLTRVPWWLIALAVAGLVLATRWPKLLLAMAALLFVIWLLRPRAPKAAR